MSSILKALKKVEEEKAAQRNAAPLASEVAKTRRRQQPSASRWKIPAVLVSVVAAAVVITIAVMGGFSAGKQRQLATSPTVGTNAAFADKNQQAVPVMVQVSSVSVASDGVSTTAGNGFAVAPKQNDRLVVQKRNEPPAGLKSQMAPKVKPIAPTPVDAVKPVADVKAVAAVKPGVAAATVPAVLTKREQAPFFRTTVGSVSLDQARPEFKVNGIAWQTESSSRLAVVNGVAVTQGATVDGAKVVEILQDRVRLSQGGRTFEIILGKMNDYR